MVKIYNLKLTKSYQIFNNKINKSNLISINRLTLKPFI